MSQDDEEGQNELYALSQRGYLIEIAPDGGLAIAPP